MFRISIVVGTRPEIIKLQPILTELQRVSQEYQLISTGQQRDLCEKTFTEFGIIPDIDLDLMLENQSPINFILAAQIALLREMELYRPDVVVVHGDTATALAGAMVGFFLGSHVVHLEAGLRSGDISSPFPEEGNRRVIDRISSLHLAPTYEAMQNLVAEGHVSSSFLTGNSIVDSIAFGIAQEVFFDADLHAFTEAGPYIFVTQHRRENFDSILPGVISVVRHLAMNTNLRFIWPVHPNPHVSELVYEKLSGLERVLLLPPQPYFVSLKLLKNASLTITDSGGIQEEAAILGTPLIITRNETERPEVLGIPTTCLVGADQELLSRSIINLSKLIRVREPFEFKGFGERQLSRKIVKKVLTFKDL